MDKVKVYTDTEIVMNHKKMDLNAPTEYVPLSEHEQLMADFKAVVKKYSDGYIFDESDDDTEQPDLMKPWCHVSGKLARSLAAKHGIEV